MSKIADALVLFEEEFKKAEDEYNFWTSELEITGYDTDNAIAAAQYYGKMLAYAEMENKIAENFKVWHYMNGFKPRLYKEDYE